MILSEEQEVSVIRGFNDLEFSVKQIYMRIIKIFILLSIVFCNVQVAKSGAKGDGRISSESDKRKAEYIYLEAIRLKNQEKTDAAFDLCRQVVALDSTHTAALYDLASFYAGLNMGEEAYSCLEKAASIEPENYWYNSTLAMLSLNMGHVEEAIDIYERLIPLNPDKPELSFVLADIYAQKGQPDSAIVCYERLEEALGVMEIITMEKFKVRRMMNDDEAAFAEIEKLIAAYPSQIRYLIMLADTYSGAGRYDEAKAAYDRAAALDPDNGYLYASLAGFYDKINDKAAAKEQIRLALVNKKIDVDTKLSLLKDYIGRMLREKAPVAYMDTLFSAVLEQHPQEVDLHKLYADFLQVQKRKKETCEQLEIVVGLEPSEPNYWLQYVAVNLSDSNFHAAIDIAERAMKYLPDNPMLYLYKGVAYSQLSLFDKAISSITEGVGKVNPDDVETLSELHGQLGDIYHQMGDNGKAYEAYETALKYFDMNVSVLNNYSYFLSLEKKDLDKAEEMILKAVKMDPKNSTYLDTYGWVLFQKGEYVIARVYLQNAVDNGADKNSEVLEHLGDALFKTDEKEEAVKMWEKAALYEKPSEILKKKIETKQYIEK